MKNRNRAACGLLLAFLAISLGLSRGAQAQEVIRPDLAGIAMGEGWNLVNRGAALERDGERTVVSFDGRPGAGAAWLDGVEFSDGTIEVMIRGRNNPGGSFVGVAFRGVDNETYDAVYFRPFNFVADNDLSRSHMVQYISHPENPWHRLREVHTGIYENRLPNPPDPDQFFRARIVISKPEVRVFVGDDPEPCLVVRELTDRNGGRIGLWMGNTSEGSFAELVIRPAEGPLEPVQGIDLPPLAVPLTVSLPPTRLLPQIPTDRSLNQREYCYSFRSTSMGATLEMRLAGR